MRASPIGLLAMLLLDPRWRRTPRYPLFPPPRFWPISHPLGVPMTAEQRAQIMPREVRATVAAYLGGKIDQWYVQNNGRGVVFIVNASTPQEAKAALEQFPLGQAGLMGFDYIPLGPLSPLRLLADQPTGPAR